ncbi:MAG: gamma carbonic anhydrase family protein [Verrucomicrobiota bacterium]
MEGLEERLDRHLGASPRLGEGVYIASTAVVIGDVSLGDHSSVWYGVVLRGDINRIEVGRYTNIQDNSVVHLSDDYPAIIGDYVTVGHGAVVHACTVGDECLIGMGSIVMDGAVVGARSIVGAGAVVTRGMEISEGSMVMGSPAKVVRELSGEERNGIRYWGEKYAANAAYCLERDIGVGGPIDVSADCGRGS